MVKTKSNHWHCQLDSSVVIILTQERQAIIDYADLDAVLKYRWCAHHVGSRWYAATHPGKGREDRQLLHMHRWILDATKGQEVDHVNGNGLDNRRCNLRFVTHSQNASNATKHKDKQSSQYKGVYPANREGAWRDAICKNRRQIALGVFESELEAAIAYNNAAKALFGEYARLNDTR